MAWNWQGRFRDQASLWYREQPLTTQASMLATTSRKLSILRFQHGSMSPRKLKVASACAIASESICELSKVQLVCQYLNYLKSLLSKRMIYQQAKNRSHQKLKPTFKKLNQHWMMFSIRKSSSTSVINLRLFKNSSTKFAVLVESRIIFPSSKVRRTRPVRARTNQSLHLNRKIRFPLCNQ